MRAVTYQTIEQGICDLIGWDPDNLSSGEFNQIKRAVTQALEQIWRDFPWPGLCVVERRQYAPTYASGSYTAGDQVYFPATDAYYEAIQDSSGEDPEILSGTTYLLNREYWSELARSYSADNWSVTAAYDAGDTVTYGPTGLVYVAISAVTAGTLPTDTDYWYPLTEFQPCVPLVESGYTAIGDVLGAYATDPSKFCGASPVSFRLVPEGVGFFDGATTRPWLHYLKRPHRFTGTDWDATVAYTAAEEDEITGSTVATGPQVYTGTGSPEGVVTANPGSLYVQQVSSTVTQLWTKGSGTGNTGWIG
jgi:hypothetical protein